MFINLFKFSFSICSYNNFKCISEYLHYLMFVKMENKERENQNEIQNIKEFDFIFIIL
jgi:hypothetical protein